MIDWCMCWVGLAGIIVEFFVYGCVDVYVYSDIFDGNGGIYEDGFDCQVGFVGVEFFWLFMWFGEQFDIILEFVLFGVIVIDDLVVNCIINEDSLFIDFDEILLFQFVWVFGFDFWENG